jgi:hypothetical protein
MMMFAIHNTRRDWLPLPAALKLQELEVELSKARGRKVSGGAIQVPGKGGTPKTITPAKAQAMPLGALANVFCKKLMPNKIDAHLCSGLKRINPDRINVTHAITSLRKEKRLRENVGRHMWTIDNMLRKIPA